VKLATAARRAGLRAEVELAGRSLKGQLKQADRLGARYVAILGDEGAQLKDMASGEQHAIDPDAVPDAVRGERPVA
jgi:histidyl-tRNA synthetase